MQVKEIEDIVGKLSALLPEGVQGIKSDLDANIRAILQSAFAQMDLVTREEFDVQTQVLNKTRMKLEAIEKTLAELEKQVSNK